MLRRRWTTAPAIDGGPGALHVVTVLFRRIPVLARAAIFCVCFQGLMLVRLPHLFYEIDLRLPAAHVELGPLRIVGGVLTAVALTIFLRAAGVLILRGKGTLVEFDPPIQFVATGPYRYVRNPVTGSLLATILGEAIALSSTGIFIMVCVTAVIAHLGVTRFEEPLLRRRFGRVYDDYCARVPRWIPRRRVESAEERVGTEAG